MMTIPFIVAFIAGVVSFLSPCVLPVIPGFLAYLAGTSLEEQDTNRRAIFLNSLFFVLGFSSVFAILGVLLGTLLGSVAGSVQLWLTRIGGIIIIVFGLYLTGLLRIGFLERGRTLPVTKRFSSRWATSFLFGAAFAAGWTPCVGAVLGSILALAVASPVSALGLLFVYSLGLGVPFLLVGLFAGQAAPFINCNARAFVYASKGFGILLIIIGILVFTGDLALLADFSFVNRWLLS